MALRDKSWFNIITSVLRADGTIGGIRFNKKDQPTEATFKDLWDSIYFRSDVNGSNSSKAKTYTGGAVENEQGVVIMCTDSQAKLNQAQLSDRTLAVAPHQLPTVKDSKLDGSANDVAGNDVVLGGTTVATLNSNGLDLTANSLLKVTTDSATTTRNNFFIRLSNSFLNWIATSVIPRLILAGGTTGQIPKKINGTDYNWAWNNYGYKATSTSNIAIPTSLGGTLVFAIGTGYDFDYGVRVRITYSSDNTKYIEGYISSYTSGNLSIIVDNFNGSGTYASWNINIGSYTGPTVTPGNIYAGTSTSSVVVGTGSKSFTASTGMSYSSGTRIRITSSGTGNYMEGNVVSYDSSTGALVVAVDNISGSGSATDWVINIGGAYPPSGTSYKSTSSSTNSIATGSLTFTVGTGYGYVVGNRIRATDQSNPANFVEGVVSSYSSGNLIIDVDTIGGSGSISLWDINLGGALFDKYNATSTSSITIGTGSKTFTIGLGYSYSSNLPVRVRIYDRDNPTTNYMEGTVSQYLFGGLVVNVDNAVGSGTISNWGIGLAGIRFGVINNVPSTTYGFTIALTTNFQNLTNLTYTTPNDGKTRTYLILVNVEAKLLNDGDSNTLSLQLYDGTNTVGIQTDTNFSAKTGFTATTAVKSTGVIMEVQTLPPNTTITVQAKKIYSDSLTAISGKLIMKEIF